MAQKKKDDAAPSAAPAAAPTRSTDTLTGKAVVGDLVMLPLTAVRPNSWNPNKMSAETRASLQYGLETDGWLKSQALLVWATDENDNEQMVIIDGQHRWEVGGALGFTEAPMALLRGVTEAKAKSLTVAMNQRRGSFDEKELQALLQSIEHEVDNLALATGIADDDMAKLLAHTDDVSALGLQPSPDEGNLDRGTVGAGASAGLSGPGGPPVGAPESTVKMVQLYLNSDNITGFQEQVALLSKHLGTTSVTDTVLKVVEDAARAASSSSPS